MSTTFVWGSNGECQVMLPRYNPAGTWLRRPVEQKVPCDGQSQRRGACLSISVSIDGHCDSGKKLHEMRGFHCTFSELDFTCRRWPKLDDRRSSDPEQGSSEPCVVEVVEHQVDEHAGDRDIEPNGKGPSGPAAMLKTTIAQAQIDGSQGEKRYDGSQYHMR